MNTHSSCWQVKLPHISAALWLARKETDRLFYYLVSFPINFTSFLFLCKVPSGLRLLQISASSTDIPSSVPTAQAVLWKDTERQWKTLQEEWHQVMLINGCLIIDAKGGQLDRAQCRKFWFDLHPPLILIMGKWHPVHMYNREPCVKSHKKSATRYWQDSLCQHGQI